MSTFSKEEQWSHLQMKDLQWSRLKKSIKHAYENVPFYREALQRIPITPDDFCSWQQFQELPFTKKHHLRENYPFQLLATPVNEVVRIHASSGTSGKPTVVAYTKNDISHWGHMVARAIYMAGGRKGDILHNAFGYGLFTGGLGIHHGSEYLGCATVPISGGNTNKQIAMIQDFKPRIICSTPSYLLNIGETMINQGINPANTSLKVAILGAEPWSEKMRDIIEQMFDLDALDIYGLSEVMGPGIGMECECKEGLHVAEDHFIVEAINPETLEPVPDGEDGELVFTSLTKEAIPIIRYRTGDVASLSRERCACGRTTIKMSRVKGRIDDMLIIRGVNVFPSEIERYICSAEELEPHYEIHLLKKGAMDHVELHVEVCELFYNSLSEQSFNDQKSLELIQKVKKTLKMELLVSVDVRLTKPKTLLRSEGKARRIIDKRPSMSATL
ncbi:MAG: phenylacetate--CoA ligase family protein [Bacillota bacterium]